MEVVLYQYPPAGRLASISPFCVKVQRALHYKGVPFRVVNTTRATRYNPRGRLPAADIGGERLLDSSEILLALERAFPAHPLLPEEPRRRAETRMFEDWADEVLYPYLLCWRWFVEPPDPARAFRFLPWGLRRLGLALYKRKVGARLKAVGVGRKPVAVVREELAALLATLEARLDGAPFLFGERPNLADIALFAQVDGLYWKPLPQARALIEAHPRLLAWYQAVEAASSGDAG